MPLNATYNSPKIQNELINTIFDSLRESIVVDLNNSSFLTLMVDGTNDRNGDEIISIGFRYIKDGVSFETLLCFEKADNRSAQGLFNVIIKRIEELRLEIKEKLISQCYDSASVNSGRLGGLKVIFLYFSNS